MSTRATILIKESREDNIHIYHHHDGYPEGVGSDLKRYLNTLTSEWHASQIADDLINNNANLDDNEYELTSCQHGDEAYGYLIDCDNKTLKCYKLKWDEFTWDEKSLIKIP